MIFPGSYGRWIGNFGLYHIVENLILNTFGTLQPPRQADNPLGEHGFHHPDGSKLGEKFIVVKFIIRRIFDRNYRLRGKKAVFDRILRDRCLALSRLRPGRFLCVLSISFYLCFS